MSGSDAPTAVLLAALGGPSSLDEVEPYLKEVRGGRATAPELVQEFRDRYARIGGRSPLLEISRAQTRGLEARLLAAGAPVPVHLGMRHWHPFLRDALSEIGRAGHRRVALLPLTPYRSSMTVGRYVEAARKAVEEIRVPIELDPIESWNDAPDLVDAFARKVLEARARLLHDGEDDPATLFTAHSLPRRVMDEGDPYVKELEETRGLVEKRLPRGRSSLAFQSAGRTPEPWLGPSSEEALRGLAEKGERTVMVVPFGFISDNLEVLYDVDIELKGSAHRLGVRLERVESLNSDPGLLDAMTSVLLPRLRGG